MEVAATNKFIETCAEIEILLSDLTLDAADHFGEIPICVTWFDVQRALDVLTALRGLKGQIDCAKHEKQLKENAK